MEGENDSVKPNLLCILKKAVFEDQRAHQRVSFKENEGLKEIHSSDANV